MKMANVKACRFCLITDVEIEVIQGTLEDVINSVFGRNMFYAPEMPSFVCKECIIQILKFNNFRIKYLTAQSILYDMVKHYGEVTETRIRNLDRNILKLKSKLSQISLGVIEWLPVEQNEKIHPEICQLGKVLDVEDEESSDDDTLTKYVDSIRKEHNQENQFLIKKDDTIEAITENIENTFENHTQTSGSNDYLLNDFAISRLASSGDVECEVCSLGSRRALDTSHRTKSYDCDKYPFDTGQLSQTKKQCLDGVTYKCDYCNEVTSKLACAPAPARPRHPAQFACEVCGYSFSTVDGVKEHKSMHRRISKDAQLEVVVTEKKQEPNVYCKSCDLHFSTRDACRRHLATSDRHINNSSTAGTRWRVRAHSPRIGPRPRAGTPRRSRSAPAALRLRHPARCAQCEKIPCRSRHRKHHQRHHQKRKRENKHTCRKCGKRFPSSAFVKYHARVHPEVCAFSCSRCGAALAHAYGLRAHLGTRDDARAHSCTICARTFTTNTGLHQHFKTHSGICPFSCRYCGKAFSRGACLTQHVRHVHLRPLLHGDQQDRPKLKIPKPSID